MQIRLGVIHQLQTPGLIKDVQWFRTLNLSERMELLCAYTDLALELNPQLPDKKHAQQAKRRIQILSAA